MTTPKAPFASQKRYNSLRNDDDNQHVYHRNTNRKVEIRMNPKASALLQRALQLHRSGSISEAEAVYLSVLNEHPLNVDALHLYGMLLHERQREKEALELLDRALQQSPTTGVLHNSRAVILIAMEQLAEAKTAVEEALCLEPTMPEAFRNLATICEKQGHFLDAIHALQKLVEVAPSRNDTLKDISRLCDQINRSDLLIAACVETLKRRPDSVAAHLTLGLTFSTRILPEQLRDTSLEEAARLTKRALVHLDRAASLKPCVETFDAWGTALRNAGRHSEALERFNQAIACSQSFPKSYEGRGRAYLELGLIDRAIEDFGRAVSIQPESPMAQFELAKIDRNGDHLAIANRLRAVLGSNAFHCNGSFEPPSSVRNRSLLHYAIAFRFEKAGNPAEAFKHFSLANSEKSPTVAVKGTEPSKIDSWLEKRNELETTFGIDRVQSCQSQCESELPIFIVSMPRSGTTLTEQIIGRHPNVFAGGERFDISDIAHTLSRRLGTERPYPLCIDQLTPETASSLAQEYLEQTERLSSSVNGDLASPQRATDKMPTNFWHLGLIACLFPNARIVHVQRNPIDVCLSCFKQNLTWPFCSLTEIVDYFDHYARLMRFWKRTLPLNIHTVRYEELVRAPDATARELIQFCGLEWDHACLDPASADNSVQTPSKWQVRQPIYQSSVNSWRRYEEQLAPLVARLMDRGIVSRDFAY